MRKSIAYLHLASSSISHAFHFWLLILPVYLIMKYYTAFLLCSEQEMQVLKIELLQHLFFITSCIIWLFFIIYITAIKLLILRFCTCNELRWVFVEFPKCR